MGAAENRLKKAILDYLHSLGHEAWNANVGRMQGHYRTGIPGLPDIQGYHRWTGSAIFIEAKIPPNSLSQEQTVFLFNAQRAGCIALKATSLNDVLVEKRLREKPLGMREPISHRRG